MERADRQVELVKIMHIEKLLDYMDGIPGWLTRNEARLLQSSALDALMTRRSGNILEVGGYCGKATVMLADAVRNAQRGKVFSVDPDESLIRGVPDVWTGVGKVSIFNQKLSAIGLMDLVTLIRSKPSDVSWSEPLSYLLVDGLHDAENVAADFRHFFGHVEKGGYVAFHDYGNSDFPDVTRFVEQVVLSGKAIRSLKEGSLIVLEKTST